MSEYTSKLSFSRPAQMATCTLCTLAPTPYIAGGPDGDPQFGQTTTPSSDQDVNFVTGIAINALSLNVKSGTPLYTALNNLCERTYTTISAPLTTQWLRERRCAMANSKFTVTNLQKNFISAKRR